MPIESPGGIQCLAAHESGHAVALLALGLPVTRIVLHPDGSGETASRPRFDFVELAEGRRGHHALSDLETELIVTHAGRVAEERWYTEVLRLGPRLPHLSAEDDNLIRFLLARFPGQVTPAMPARRKRWPMRSLTITGPPSVGSCACCAPARCRSCCPAPWSGA